MSNAFVAFLARRRADLRSIANRTQGELSPEDMESESWLMAVEIGQKRGWPFNFLDEDDQSTLLAWLHNRFVKYANKAIRYALKLDRDWDSDDGDRAGEALARLLTAPADSDPQIRQQTHEAATELQSVVQRSYSQAAAYVLLLLRVDWDFDDLANKLQVGVLTLRQRIKSAGLLARVQPSLFDGIEAIAADFEPWHKIRCQRKPIAPTQTPQVPLLLSKAI